jgi:hypothetical protein
LATLSGEMRRSSLCAHRVMKKEVRRVELSEAKGGLGEISTASCHDNRRNGDSHASSLRKEVGRIPRAY